MPLDPLRIFAPGSPIPLVMLNVLVRTTAAALPGAAGASPAAEAELRLYVQHAIACHDPCDGREAMLAATLVMLQAQVAEMFRIADAPATPDEIKRRHRSLGASVSRTAEQFERRLERARALRLKEEQTPSERSGYWFHDVSVPGPPPPPQEHAAPDSQKPTHRDAPAQASAASDSQKPMHRDALAPAAAAPEAPRQFNPMPSEPEAAPKPAAPAIAGVPARPAPTATQPLPPFAAQPPHSTRAEAAPRTAAHLLDAGEPASIRAMSEAAAKDAIARALRSPPPSRG